jgi:hypothetical protein
MKFLRRIQQTELENAAKVGAGTVRLRLVLGPMQLNEIHALIQLLDDPDEGVYSHVRERLMERGSAVLPVLERHRAESLLADEHASRLDEVVHGLRFERLRERTLEWVFGEGHDPVEAALIVHEAVQPKVDADQVRKDFEQLRRAVWLELNEDLTGFERLQVVNHMLFEVLGFGRAAGSTLRPGHALVGEVMERKQGNALGIGFLYWALARSLDLDVHVVDSPHHFMLCMCYGMSLPKEEAPHGAVMCYIDPFSQGTLLAPDQIHSWLDLPTSEQPPIAPPALGFERLIRFVSLALVRADRHFLAKHLDELMVGWGAPERD